MPDGGPSVAPGGAPLLGPRPPWPYNSHKWQARVDPPTRLPDAHVWPRLRWRWEFLLSLVPFILAVVTLAFPELVTDPRLANLRVTIAAASLFGLVLVPLLDLATRAMVIAGRRIGAYPRLHLAATSQHETIADFRRNLSQLLVALYEQPLAEIGGILYENGTLYISIAREQVHDLLRIGDRFVVVDTSDALVMGIFRVTELRTTEYYAQGVAGIDPLWTSYMSGVGHVTMVPHMAAIAVPLGREGLNDR